eukprot:12922141-Prorocentrum_lima.AAC.1
MFPPTAIVPSRNSPPTQEAYPLLPINHARSVSTTHHTLTSRVWNRTLTQARTSLISSMMRSATR